jgi:hypothetical protein
VLRAPPFSRNSDVLELAIIHLHQLPPLLPQEKVNGLLSHSVKSVVRQNLCAQNSAPKITQNNFPNDKFSNLASPNISPA